MYDMYINTIPNSEDEKKRQKLNYLIMKNKVHLWTPSSFMISLHIST